MEAMEKLVGSPKTMVKTDHCAAGLEIKLVIILFIWKSSSLQITAMICTLETYQLDAHHCLLKLF